MAERGLERLDEAIANLQEAHEIYINLENREVIGRIAAARLRNFTSRVDQVLRSHRRMPDGKREAHCDPINVPVTKVRLTDCAQTCGSAAFIAPIAKLITAIPTPSDTMSSRVKPMINTSEDRDHAENQTSYPTHRRMHEQSSGE